jgi:iron complex transport system substrate-binding protein
MSALRIRLVIGFFLFLLPLPTLYSPLPAFSEPITIKDALGRSVTLQTPPKRIVSLAPSLTEILFALGLDEEIAGVTNACDYPPRAREKAVIGGAVDPDLERLLKIRPDLILGIKGLHRAGLEGEMDRLHLPLFLTNPASMERILEDIETIGRLTGRLPEADRLTAGMRERIDRIHQRIEGRRRPRVLYVLWNDPLMSVTDSSYIGEMIDLAGGDNIARTEAGGYVRIGMEEVLARDPEVVIFASEMGEGPAAAERDRWRRWDTLSAVKNNRMVVMNSDLLHRPGPRVVDALEALAEVLHPGDGDGQTAMGSK